MGYGVNVLMTKEDGLAIITLNRPAALNALNTDTLNELKAAVTQADMTADVDVIIITGAGGKAFVAGADIAEMQQAALHRPRAHPQKRCRALGVRHLARPISG